MYIPSGAEKYRYVLFCLLINSNAIGFLGHLDKSIPIDMDGGRGIVIARQQKGTAKGAP
jgi:hypothetical protein